jgi:serine/threonine protein kinase
LENSPLQDNPEVIEKHWTVFLYVLRFLTRKIYRTPQEQEEHERKPHLAQQAHKREVRSRALHGLTLEQSTEKFITNGNPRKLYKTLEDAGRGGFGSVYIAKRVDDKRRVAIKRVPHLSEREQWNNFDEIYFLDACAHACVVKYYQSYISRDELWVSLFPSFYRPH